MALIPLRWKIWGLVALAFVAGVLGFARWRVSVAETKAELVRARRRIDTIQKSREIENEVENLTADELLRRSRRWVRGSR